MARTDLPLHDLRLFNPVVREPADFQEFWDATLSSAHAHELAVDARRVQSPYVTIDVDDVSFAGFGGDRIKAWFTKPRGIDGSLPVVVEYLPYGGGRDLPGTRAHWAHAGFAHLLVDTRGQGGSWGGGGSTPDPHGTGASSPGFATRGIESRENYYYRRLITDGVRAVEAAMGLTGVEPSRIAVQGISQGGGIALAVAALVPGLAAVMPDVPFLCNFERALDIGTEDPYAEIVRYLAVHRGQGDAVLHTLSYFDAVNFAKRATCPALFSVALMDLLCPPSTVYSAFNAYLGQNKSIVNYPYNGHEGGQSYQRDRQILWLTSLLG